MMSSTSFDVGTAALEHLELLNSSNSNPLEIAAQFRTLLRRKKSPETISETNYIDYRILNKPSRRRPSRISSNSRSKSLGRIQYFLDENPTSSIDENFIRSESQSCWGLSEDQQSTEELCGELTIESDSSENIPSTSLFSEDRPKISWKQLREIKQNEINGLSLITSSTKPIDSSISSSMYRSRSSSNSIRTPSISPISSPRPTYTLSRFNSASIKTHDEDFLFPIADCNLIIKHKLIDRNKCSFD